MVTFAILGVTGETGSEIFRQLAGKPGVKLHIYARSASKLESMFPSLSSFSDVQTFIGASTDVHLLTRCLADCTTIFSTVATNTNRPGLDVAQTIARSIVAALESLRSDFNTQLNSSSQGACWTSPRLIWLSSGSLHPPAIAGIPAFAKPVLYRALWYIYEDLRLAQEYMASSAPWLPVTAVCPGGLVHEEAQGFTIGSNVVSDTVGYKDLAGGMIAMASEEASKGQVWSVASKGPPRPDLMLKENMHRALFGLLDSYIPGFFAVTHWLGWQ